MSETKTQELNTTKIISEEEADHFLNTKKKDSFIIANAVFMCIISPSVLILMASVSDNEKFGITEAFATAAGLTFLFGMIAVAVYLLIMCGIREKRMEYLERENFEVETALTEIIKEKRDLHIPVFAKGIASGVVLCILASLPLILASIMEAPDYIGCAFTSLLLLMVGIGVNRIISVSIVKNSYDILLQEGEFSKEEKLTKRKMDIFSSTYWCLITAIYLGWSFFTRQWNTTWMIWPVAGVLFAAITGIFKMVTMRGRKENYK